ncbi:hypothetical protein L345_17252, partial [Ophiophagus hannah]
MTQPPSLSVSPGGTVRITCTRAGGSITGYYVHWYQQKPGTKPILVIYQYSSRPSGIPERFSGSIDSSSNSATLSISSVQPEDEADYYCSSNDGNAQCTVIALYGEVRQKPEDKEEGGRDPSENMRSPSLQQLQTLKDPEFVAAGRTVTISCRYDGGNLGDGNHPWWAQQIPGNKPRMLIYSTSSRPSGIPERFSGSRSGNVMSLTITGALVEDEATYYCCVWTGSSLQQLQTLKDAEFVAVGGTVTISCQYNGGNLGDGHYPLWTQETAGNQHRGVISYTSNRPSGVPERFSGSRSGNMMSLTITGALVEDEATYYCCVWSGNQSHSIDGQSTWTQPSTSSASPGGTIKLSCTTTQSSYCIAWYQQKPGEAPRYIQCSGYGRGEGIPDRFTATMSGTTGTLTITNVQAGDEAVYYCASWNGAGTVLHGIDGQSACNTCSKREEGIPDRFTATQSGAIGTLTITNAEAGDEANYYCASWDDVFHSGPSLQQLQNLKDPEFVASGGTVTISCQYDGGNLGDGNYPWWSQQIPGHPPRALIYTTSTRPLGVPEHFSGS